MGAEAVNRQKIEAWAADVMQNTPQSQQTADPYETVNPIMQDVIGGTDGKDATGTIVNRGDRGYNNHKKWGDIDNGEEVHLRNGSERSGSQNSGGPVSAVEAGAGRNQVWHPETAVADSAISSLSYGQEVSTASLGIPGGSTDGNISIVTGGETAAIRAARRIVAKNGLKLTLFAGDNLKIDNMYGKTDSVCGYIMGDKVYIRADHPKYTAEQLMRHEAGHAKINRGEIDVQAVRDRIDQKHTDYISTLYAVAYEGSDLTPDEIWTEVICDSLADMNVFAPYRVGSTVETLLNEVKESTVAEAQAIRGPPADVSGKMSREELFGGTFPSYKFSHSDANEQATRWAHRKDVHDGDRRLFSYHGSWYLVEALDNADMGYQIVEKLTQRQLNAHMKEVNDAEGQSVTERISRIGEITSQRERFGSGKPSSNNALAGYRQEDMQVQQLAQDQTGGRESTSDGNGNLPRSRSSIEDSRIEFENSRGYQLSKRIQKLESARKKAAKGSERRNQLNKEIRQLREELAQIAKFTTGESSRELNLENLEHWIEENYSDDVVGDVGAKTSDLRHEVKESQTATNTIGKKEAYGVVPEDARTSTAYDAVTEEESVRRLEPVQRLGKRQIVFLITGD